MLIVFHQRHRFISHLLRHFIEAGIFDAVRDLIQADETASVQADSLLGRKHFRDALINAPLRNAALPDGFEDAAYARFRVERASTIHLLRLRSLARPLRLD